MQRAPAESAETFHQEEEADKFVRSEDILAHMRLKKSTFWYTIQSNERIILLHIIEDEAPWIKYSMTTKADLVVTFHFMKCLATKLGSILHVPPTAKSKRELDEFLDGV
ncbi:hypothetical protein HPB49_022394 [Dermacentor silvarum]|uniref:Uncharacterized protein n=1 Tax=Dermacentor silvarum TaxID=543639 RepID=A0ACB8D0F0_DERSI|nr:hypothetical protein HPB49_022394 [Dermacentor silvarum]